jgi:GNAT superfamily N-acetyltransferase
MTLFELENKILEIKIRSLAVIEHKIKLLDVDVMLNYKYKNYSFYICPRDRGMVFISAFDNARSTTTQAVGWIIIHENEKIINETPVYEVTGLFVDTKYRGINLGQELYSALLESEFTVMCDDTLTIGGVSNLKKIIASGKYFVSYYDETTKIITPTQPSNFFTVDTEWRVILSKQKL